MSWLVCLSILRLRNGCVYEGLRKNRRLRCLETIEVAWRLDGIMNSASSP